MGSSEHIASVLAARKEFERKRPGRGKSSGMSLQARKKVQAATHRERLEKLKKPQTGVKPPDPPSPDRIVVGDGLDEWRENK